MNLADIEAIVYDRLNLPAAPDSTRVAQIRRSINSAYYDLMGKPALSVLRRQLLTFTSVANTPFAVLPQAAIDVLSVADRVRNWLLTPIAVANIRFEDPALLMTTYPWAFAKYNLQAAVTQQPSAAAQIWAKSTSATDGATKTLYVETIRSDGSMVVESVALNGTTAVQVGTSSAIVTITKAWLATTANGSATTAAGTVGLYEGSGTGTQLSSIFPGRGAARFSLLHFYPTPTSANTYTADCKVLLTPLANASDEPLIPDDYRTVLAHAAIMAGCQGRENANTFSLARSQYQDVKGELILFCSKLSEPESLNDGIPRYSQLGAYFPAGS